jgi:hypothetical protein
VNGHGFLFLAEELLPLLFGGAADEKLPVIG